MSKKYNNKIPLIEEINIPLSTVQVYGLMKDEPYSFFLDSGMDAEKLGRYSFIGASPFLVFKSKANKIQLIDWPGTNKERRRDLTGNPFYALKELFDKFKLPATPEFPPFFGGGVGYFSYDLCHFIEKLPSRATDDLNIPDCIMGFYDRVVIFDHLLGKIYIASCGFPEIDEEKNKRRSQNRLEELKGVIVNPPSAGFRQSEEKDSTPPLAGRGFNSGISEVMLQNTEFASRIESNFTKEGYKKAILKAKEYIRNGDIYQVNLSQRFTTELKTEPYELYKRLRAINPAPFAAFLNFGDVVVASASPERFLKKQDRYIETRPIKGTRPRGANEIEDAKLKEELLASAKDRAEHVMIVDLERNDLGRVSRYGSVRPSEFIILEGYATVFHLVSTVAGELKTGCDAIDCLLNCFPGGSITGAPKIRSMEIIDELEPTKRSIYTGALGYISFSGDMDTSIVIRTFIIKDGKAYFQVGGGIVADSDPEAEYIETLDKAKALMESLKVNTSDLIDKSNEAISISKR